MSSRPTRRDFLSQLGVTAAVAVGGAAAGIGVTGIAHAQEKPKGVIPDKPFRIGHMTFFTGAGAVLGEPMYKGNLLAAEEINAQGGLLGKRKIEILKADEAAGTDANTKEMRRLRLSEKIDMFMGITSSGNTPALGPVAEELKLLTIFVDGCTDFLFDKAVPNPRYIFRITNIQSADGSTCALGVAATWPRHQDLRAHPPRLLLRAELLRPLQRRHQEDAAQGEERLRGLAQALRHRLHPAHHQDAGGEAGSAGDLMLGRRLHRLLQAGAPARTVRQDEGRHHAGVRLGAPGHREGPSGGRLHRRPRQLPLHLSGRQPLAAQQDLRREVQGQVQRVPQLPGRGRVHARLTCSRRRWKRPTSWRVAGRTTTRSSARSRA